MQSHLADYGMTVRKNEEFVVPASTRFAVVGSNLSKVGAFLQGLET